MLHRTKAFANRHCRVVATGFNVALYLVVAVIFYTQVEEKPCQSAAKLEAEDYDSATCVEPWTVIDSLYFIMVSMSTVGYGDLSPSTSLSRVLTIFFIIIGVAVVFYQSSQLLANASDACERRVVAFCHNLLDRQAQQKNQMTGRSGSSASLGKMVDLDGDGSADVVEPPTALVFWLQSYAFNVVVFVALQLASAAAFAAVQPGVAFGDGLYLSVVTATTVGYGDVPIQTQAARLFSFFHILLSVSWLGAAISQLEPLRAVRRQQLQRMELLKRKLDENLITSLDRDGNGVNMTEFVVGMLCNLGAEMCGEPLVWEDVAPFVQQFQSLDADRSGILTKADLQLIAQKQREAMEGRNPKLAKRLEKKTGDRGSELQTPRGSQARVYPEGAPAPAGAGKAPASAPAAARKNGPAARLAYVVPAPAGAQPAGADAVTTFQPPSPDLKALSMPAPSQE